MFNSLLMEMNVRKIYYTEKLFTVSLNVKLTLLSSIMLRDNVKDREKGQEKNFKCRFFKRKAKAKGNIWRGNLCISVCMLIKNQKAKK